MKILYALSVAGLISCSSSSNDSNLNDGEVVRYQRNADLLKVGDRLYIDNTFTVTLTNKDDLYHSEGGSFQRNKLSIWSQVVETEFRYLRDEIYHKGEPNEEIYSYETVSDIISCDLIIKEKLNLGDKFHIGGSYAISALVNPDPAAEAKALVKKLNSLKDQLVNLGSDTTAMEKQIAAAQETVDMITKSQPQRVEYHFSEISSDKEANFFIVCEASVNISNATENPIGFDLKNFDLHKTVSSFMLNSEFLGIHPSTPE